MMSPNSLRKAEALGYTNVKVYREGYPEWLERNIGVIAAPYLKEAWIDKDIPHVLVDVRPASTAQGRRHPRRGVDPAVAGSGATRRPSRGEAQGADHGLRRRRRHRGTAGGALIKTSGQINVNVVGGGFDAWKAAGLQVAGGNAADEGGVRAETTPRASSRSRSSRSSPRRRRRRDHPRRAQCGRSQRGMIKGASAHTGRGDSGANERDPQGQADRHPLLDGRPRRDGLSQAEGDRATTSASSTPTSRSTRTAT